MDKVTWEARRQRAVERLLQGEAFTSVCRSEGVSRRWLYKWWARHTGDKATWFQDDSRRPHTQVGRTPAEIEEIVQVVRLELYNQGQFCGAQAIRWRLEDLGVHPVPSVRTIGRVLARHDLTYRRTGRYEPKGVPYPKLCVFRPISAADSGRWQPPIPVMSGHPFRRKPATSGAGRSDAG